MEKNFREYMYKKYSRRIPFFSPDSAELQPAMGDNASFKHSTRNFFGFAIGFMHGLVCQRS
jgi:hypothetical protein